MVKDLAPFNFFRIRSGETDGDEDQRPKRENVERTCRAPPATSRIVREQSGRWAPTTSRWRSVRFGVAFSIVAQRRLCGHARDSTLLVGSVLKTGWTMDPENPLAHNLAALLP